MARLRVGIACYPSFGGSGVVATELGRTLAGWGHEVHIFSYASPFRLAAACPNLRLHEVEGFSYPLFKYPPYDLALASRMIEVFEEGGLDIIHSHYAIPHAISAYLARESVGGKFKTVTTLHGTDITLVGADRSYFPITRFGIEVSDAVTAVSQHLKEETLQIFQPRREVQVIHNFVDTKHFSPKPHEEKRKEKTLLHISNFRPVKRVGDIVRAFSMIAQKVPSKLQLVGDGPDLRPVMEQVKNLGLQAKVEFLGNQTDIVGLIQEADLYCLASETESFGLSVLEAMACGVPSVVPAVGGLPELITNNETGLLVAEKTPEAMAAAAIPLLQDLSLWKKFSLACRARAVEFFEREKVVRRYLDLYEKVLSG